MIVDAHAHVWALDPEAYPWRPTFGFVPTTPAAPQDLLGAMDRHGIEHALLVQPSAYGSDHRFLLETTRAHPTRFLAVGLVDPADTDDTASAVSLVRESQCVGLRVNLSLDIQRAMAQATGDGWAAIAAAGIPVSLRATPVHHDLVLRILDENPTIRFVIDHLGLPEPEHLAEAAARLAAFAEYEHCRLKVAGLTSLSRAGPPYRDTWPLVADALRSFGAARLVWGSDFPTADAIDGYGDVVGAVESMPFLDAADRRLLMATNAVELWGSPSGAPSR
jgi:predicted TIM-barrel fold metal-dependent hydrolase